MTKLYSTLKSPIHSHTIAVYINEYYPPIKRKENKINSIFKDLKNRLAKNNAIKHIRQVESAHIIILNYLHNSDLIMTKQMFFLHANFSEDLRVLNQYVFYTTCTVNFHCFFK